MKPQFLPFLRCPRCGGHLGESNPRGTTTSLACTSCPHAYALLDGMPRLLVENGPEDRSATAFGRQWKKQQEGAFETDTIYGETTEQELQSFLDRFGIAGPRELGGLRILDIGCGSGRLTRSLALFAPDALVLGGDRSDAAGVAYRRCRDLPNAFVAQFDLAAPPFPPESFDLVYADGVLPHVPEPRAALQSLDRLLRPGGRLFAWIYPRSFSPYRLLRDLLFRPYRFPPTMQHALCWILGVPLYTAFKPWEIFRGPRRRGLREVVFMLHDNLTPQYQHRRTVSEFTQDFEQLGYTEVHALDPPVGIIGSKPAGVNKKERSPGAVGQQGRAS